MTLPDWFCPVVCSGLDLSDLLPNTPKPNNEIKFAAEAKKFRFKSLARARAHLRSKAAPKISTLSVNSFEENEAINIDNDQLDWPQNE
jgi:hypothetical protein